MNFKGVVLGTTFILSMASFSSSAALNEEQSQDVNSIITQSVGIGAQETVRRLSTKYPNNVVDVTAEVAKAYQMQVGYALEEAMLANPDLATQIAQAAIDAGIPVEQVTSSALASGIDPTLIPNTATAAGQEDTAAPTNTRRTLGSRGSSVSPN
ncbi:hypothetical protein [Vibrio viridaestus]|uniref:Uncharacterized protein n=1 Tax=Vibrio viridaestus TaxID=2487322 RepID=A0A3N9TIZ6_9VIBR|nr:hypothetical protein [Vibrio viridaestus]RQW63894.1 hypothetical protein EES38_04615 [Vibrio viridaestus]